MTDTKALRDRIQSSGLKDKFIAKTIDISAYSLQRKIDNDNEFLVGEVAAISQLLGLSLEDKDAIFSPSS